MSKIQPNVWTLPIALRTAVQSGKIAMVELFLDSDHESQIPTHEYGEAIIDTVEYSNPEEGMRMVKHLLAQAVNIARSSDRVVFTESY